MLKEGTTLRATIGEERYRRVSKEAERLGVRWTPPTCCSPGLSPYS